MHQSSPVGKSADCTRELGQGNIFEQISLGAHHEPAEDEFIVIECCEDKCRRKEFGLLQFFQNFEPVSLWEVHVKEHHIRPGFGDNTQCFIPIFCLSYNINVVHHLQECLDSLTHEGLIFDEADPNHAVPPERGIHAVSRKPLVGCVSISSLPPTCSRRSRMPIKPCPGCTSLEPRPSSLACIAMPLSVRASSIQRLSAAAWRIAF